MAKFVQVGDRVVNLDFVVSARFSRDESARVVRDETVLVFPVFHPGAGELYEEYFYGDESRIIRDKLREEMKT